MTARHPSPPSRPSTATAAFLRGVQRRAVLVAWLQAGDQEAAAGIAEAAARAFLPMSADVPMEQWPVRYWGLLVDHPALRAPAPGARWPAGLDWLGELGNGPRAAVLLRLVGGLEPAAVAAALGVAPAAAHAGLREALPRLADGRHDPLAWQARQQALREALDTLPAAALPTLPAPPAPARAARSHRATPWLWAGVAACALALAATFLPLRLPGSPDPDGPPDLARAESDPLPPSQAPAVPLEPDLVLLSHPDLEQLANAEDAAVVDELGLYAWYAARLSRDARSRGGEGDGGR